VKKDDGVWSIPKGISEGEEDGLVAAKREFEEELGVAVSASHFIPLKPVKQKGGKIVHAWAAEGDVDVTNVMSNTFRMEYPPKSGRWIDVHEVDRAEWFGLEEAAVKMLSGQQGLLEELAAMLSDS
jgi:predicted NUDIX family NTP pyrophosphohydrolase